METCLNHTRTCALDDHWISLDARQLPSCVHASHCRLGTASGALLVYNAAAASTADLGRISRAGRGHISRAERRSCESPAAHRLGSFSTGEPCAQCCSTCAAGSAEAEA